MSRPLRVRVSFELTQLEARELRFLAQEEVDDGDEFDRNDAPVKASRKLVAALTRGLARYRARVGDE